MAEIDANWKEVPCKVHLIYQAYLLMVAAPENKAFKSIFIIYILDEITVFTLS